MDSRIITIPNILSLIRIYSSFPIVVFFWLGNYKVVLIVLILAYITDAVDGFVARQFNQVSDWGKVLDPLGDKVLSTSVSLLLLQKGILDLYFVVLVILRDFLISVFSVKKIKNEKFVFRAVFVGKLLTFLLAILYSLSVLNLMNSVSLSVVKILEIVCLLFVLISGTYYLMIYLKNDKNVNQ
jgi:cardiolipin synthase